MAKRIFLGGGRPEPAYYTLLGLSTQQKDYHLSFLLNKLPEFKFTRFEDLLVNIPEEEEPAHFSLYTCFDEEGFNTFTLISNRNSNQYLVPSLRQTDYLMIIEGPFKKQKKEELIKALRTIPNMLLATEINPSDIKQFESLITDLELHIMKSKKATIPNT
ncbi:MAG: IPExxxVDY family protein [Bacteroidales bacterium]|nr:IPExxxVDY family protein [Bacteroidales bacterium]